MWNKNLQEPSPRIVLSTRLQPCPLALLFVAEDTENKFRAVKKLLVENHYEVLMVDAGGPKRYVLHTSTPVVRQKPQMNLWLEFASHAHDWILTFLFVISLWCLYCTRLQYTLFRWDSVFDLLSACVPWSLPEDAKQILCGLNLRKRLESTPLNFKSQVSILYQLPSIERSVKFVEVFPTRMNDVPQSACSSPHLVFLSTLEYVGSVDAIPRVVALL